MSLNLEAFNYLQPTDAQIVTMADLRQRASVYMQAIEAAVPDGPDKTYLLRKLREVAMWANVAVTRQPDGTPRTE